MPPNTKITLSPEELQLVTDGSWILTKRGIIEKVVHLFSNLSEEMTGILEMEKAALPQPVLLSRPKISRGENYLQLPYVMLDYPRCFDSSNIFAIRTMFWWGNFFSCTLHLAGGYKKMFEESLCKNLTVMERSNYYVCINEDQWQHHFEADNYIVMNTQTNKEIRGILLQQPFIKIAQRFSLQQWIEMPGLLKDSFSELIRLVRY